MERLCTAESSMKSGSETVVMRGRGDQRWGEENLNSSRNRRAIIGSAALYTESVYRANAMPAKLGIERAIQHTRLPTPESFFCD